MQSSRYFPFERNRYFYGKLLTVRDFESEQKYFNDKRRLLNRLLYGPGVVSGLQVIKVDDKSVSVEMGVALDDMGREIVVSSPVTLKLSMATGFSNNEYAKNVYLCIAYDEKDKEPVHSIANSARVEEASEYNRVSEGYKLFVKEEAPAPTKFAYENLVHSTSVLYQDTQVRVMQIAPRYVPVGELFEVKIRIEKTLQTPRVALDFQVDQDASSPLQTVDGATTFQFADPGDGKATHYEFSYQMRASGTPETQGKVSFVPSTAKLSIGDLQYDLDPSSVNVVEAVTGAVGERILQDYYNRSLDQSLEVSGDSCIYLAKINLLQVGPTYMIEQVETVPFGEYIYNSTMMMKLGLLDANAGSAGTFGVSSSAETLPAGSEPSLAVEYDRAKQEMHFKLGVPRAPKPQESNRVATGVAEISLQAAHRSGINPFGKPTRNFYSDEITHGLGLGDVLITTGVENSSSGAMSDILKQGERTYYGDADVFEESEFDPDAPHVSVGVVVYPKKGTFRIGVKLHHSTDVGKIRIRWWALQRV
ncbi:MAG: hypothetical protein ACXVP5_12215, partial [Tumebacillaceae bacterium]